MRISVKAPLLCSLALATVATASCSRAAAPVGMSDKPTEINGQPVIGASLPPAKSIGEMSWTKFDGFEQKMGELRGKAVILDFWATYCKPCLEAIPHLIALQKQYGKENLEIIGLHVGGDEDRVKVPSFVKSLDIDYTLGVPEPELTRFIFANDSAIPQTAVFDRQGNMVRKFVGYNDTIKDELDAAVERAVNPTSK
jgi:thiol-disulfide isomerase/thioredoxin